MRAPDLRCRDDLKPEILFVCRRSLLAAFSSLVSWLSSEELRDFDPFDAADILDLVRPVPRCEVSVVFETKWFFLMYLCCGLETSSEIT